MLHGIKQVMVVWVIILFGAGRLYGGTVQPLSDTQLHAVMGIVTNFILDDGVSHKIRFGTYLAHHHVIV